MLQTLVGRFHNPSDAEVARNLLVADGIPDDNIMLRAQGAGLSGAMDASHQSGNILHGIERFFEHLFGKAGRDDDPLAEAMPPGGAVIAVTVDDGQASRIAKAALVDMGAVGIEEKPGSLHRD
jgi:hypothetical protein